MAGQKLEKYLKNYLFFQVSMGRRVEKYLKCYLLSQVSMERRSKVRKIFKKLPFLPGFYGKEVGEMTGQKLEKYEKSYLFSQGSIGRKYLKVTFYPRFLWERGWRDDRAKVRKISKKLPFLLGFYGKEVGEMAG